MLRSRPELLDLIMHAKRDRVAKRILLKVLVSMATFVVDKSETFSACSTGLVS